MFLFLFSFFLCLSPLCKAEPLKVGIIIPMEHTALQEITEGFVEGLKKAYPRDLSFLIKNAQGDANIQKIILQQMGQQGVDLYVPVGTSTTQMTCALVKEKPIVSLAAQLNPGQERMQPNCVGVEDEVPVQFTLEFLKEFFPQIQNLTLVYSSSEKVLPEVQAAEEFCHTHGFKLTKIMVQTHQDLYTLGKTLSADTQALLILKDHLIVSGLPVLLQQAHNRHIPLIASDEGSVKNGAHWALGVFEKSIGEKGALLADKILKGAKIETLAPIKMTDLVLFLHEESLSRCTSLSRAALEQAAHQKKYKVIVYKDMKSS